MKQEYEVKSGLMKAVIISEEAGITAVSIFVLSQNSLGLPFWVWFLLFFSPDISMLGYLINTEMGAFFYNLFHHRGVALLVFAIGFYTHSQVGMAVGTLLFAHSSFDRMMGYGLKYGDSFKHTNLGWLPGRETKGS